MQVIKQQMPLSLPPKKKKKKKFFTYNKTYTNTKHKLFEELVSSVLPLLKKKKKSTWG